ncbi:MTH1187 family thiamine-binding protein [Halarcobacter sp.]|uniref:MTH1187 family thiamine-binding protein n=1 Tax=Halarcobacter sp. TaxID=2321133 RepID=UPI002AAA8A5F|nr:MTH1187 family thiamine-binding protein [Halarcobacter sp.]
MSVLLQMAMFPTDHGESKSEYVAEVIKVIRESGFPYQLTPMATIIETEKLSDALNIIQKCYDTLDRLDCNRVYAPITFDIRKGHKNRLKGKVKSIENKIGEVSK